MKCLRRSLVCKGSFFSPHFDTVKPAHAETHTSLHKGTHSESFGLRLQRHAETSALLTSQPRLQLSADLGPALSGTSGWALCARPFVFVGNIPNTDILYVWVSPGCCAEVLCISTQLSRSPLPPQCGLFSALYNPNPHSGRGAERGVYLFNFLLVGKFGHHLPRLTRTQPLPEHQQAWQAATFAPLCCVAEKNTLSDNKTNKKNWLSCDFFFLFLMSFPQMEIPIPSYDLT